MDPTTNPTPTPTPEPGANPVPEPPAAPGVPPVPGAPAGVPNPEPVNPVINPGGNPAPAAPVFQPGAANGLSATDPIMQPEAPKAPDPIEEELKAPMKAAGPVPGSIGSAVSGPQSEGGEPVAPSENPFESTKPAQTPSVSFSDPAAEAQGAAGAPAKPAGKKNNKTTLILIAVAVVIVIVLVVVLVMQLMGGSSSSQGSSSGGSSTAQGGGSSTIEEPGGDGGTVAVEAGTMTCTKEMDALEVSKTEDKTSGTITISVEFADSKLTSVSLTKTLAGDESSKPETQKATAEELTPVTAQDYYLTVGEDDELDLSIDSIKDTYEGLDFTCEVL